MARRRLAIEAALVRPTGVELAGPLLVDGEHARDELRGARDFARWLDEHFGGFMSGVNDHDAHSAEEWVEAHDLYGRNR
jgi:hypothetical protein